MAIPKFTDNQIEAISKIIADTNEGVSGSDLTRLLSQIGIDDPSTHTKWRRLDYHLKNIQNKQNSANNVVQFIHNAMEPSRFIDDIESFSNMRLKLNKVLLLNGLKLNNSGKVIVVNKAETLDEAQSRANELKRKLTLRTIHSNLLMFCEKEYLQENYFHAVFEAVKSLLDRIRELTNLHEDGIPLVMKAFNEKKPILSFNKYQTSSEQNELMGFRSLLIGLIKMVRNPHAHELKVKWAIEEKDALDVLTMVSYVHRRLDETFKTGY
ncbi:TIGR02391 family protein [Virgibacillus sp. AGTR]|uniref:TIGR02391 family protein n=1 Tax=unclassified Virgibacillus TaxID=2620237 RepID=UPI000EF523EF|nr:MULTISPECIES: TIGR02391 family protein [unclassified Virgibacillus]MCC2250534.1 TIGR02391 family protein [Virgibacillus sp. AGTR]QRZ18315.1 TIGR02391 family protein [Virgibacillus sp. AGTR]